jgi:ribonucleoside-diphosphate reductase alpha chain
MESSGLPQMTDTVSQASQRKNIGGLTVERRHTQAGRHPYDEIAWEKRTAQITDENGKVIFEQRDVEVPGFWSQIATNIVVSKYFRGKIGTVERETSVKQLIDRVVLTIGRWGRKDGYFASEEDAQAFEMELTHALVNQKVSFNSPVWFNCGVEEVPQCSACFINSVEDTMESILDLAKREGMLFKWGSGTGSNLSTLRSSKESVAGGGTASGPVSFMKGYDAFAGVIKSGGKTRRAAKMIILNVDHPDILEFIKCKAHEEKKAWALIEQGYDGSFTGEAYSSVFYQNANHSIRVTDEFMQAVEEDREWRTRAVTTGDIVDTYRARDILKEAAEAAWICGDPGVQYHTTINRWHTCPNTAPINASNPCSEYMFLDDTACNLASLNLMKFLRDDNTFDVEDFRYVCRLTILGQEIIVDNAGYPSEKIKTNSHLFRPLGLGYANLGSLLMSLGLPYDSDDGRNYAAAVTALMCGEAYYQSARVAEKLGPFAGYAVNRDPMLRVIGMHRAHAYDIPAEGVPSDLLAAAKASWDAALEVGTRAGFRNSQVTVLAPTGTIGFMMDCDTTGVEPDIALVKYKKLVGGGVIKIVNNTVPRALKQLGYSEDQVAEIVAHIDETGTIEGAPHLREVDLPVFDCAFRAQNGERSIHYMGHIKMMSAVQPFLSGAISKTVNMPTHATPEEIEQAYIDGWKFGLKALAVYRDGSKRLQPLNTGLETKQPAAVTGPMRRKLPDTRAAITHKFDIAGHEGYITVGMYEDGSPGEIFLVMAKEGSTISGVMDSFATAISLALQYGVPLQALVDKFSHVRFEPSGFTKNPEIPMAKSVVDYIFRWLASKFLDGKAKAEAGVIDRSPTLEGGGLEAMVVPEPLELKMEQELAPFKLQTDAPPCPNCGLIMIRSGACYKCLNCGTTSGCG